MFRVEERYRTSHGLWASDEIEYQLMVFDEDDRQVASYMDEGESRRCVYLTEDAADFLRSLLAEKGIRVTEVCPDNVQWYIAEPDPAG